ncbi:MAG: glycosyltransferase family 39 protein [Acidobacteria bacterium]|nr:glycosyltransferase family 39 protein [Acidobacteriota bacterium]
MGSLLAALIRRRPPTGTPGEGGRPGQGADASRQGWRRWGVLAGLLAVLATFPLCRSGYLREAFTDIDEVIYLVTADAMAQGQRLYTDIWDHKPPLLYHLYGWVLRADPSVRAIRWCALFLAAGNTLLVFLLARRLFSAAGGVAAAWLFAVFTGFYWANALQTELFLVLLQLAALLVLLRRPGPFGRPVRLFLVGLLFGAACMIKYVALFTFVPLALLAAWGGREHGGWRKAAGGLAAGVAGFAAVPVFYLVTMGLDGTLADAYAATVSYNAVYVSHDAWKLFVTYGRFFLLDFAREQWFLLALGFGGAALAAARLRRATDREASFARALVLVWLGASLVAAASPLKFLHHYNYMFLPGLCCFAGIFFSRESAPGAPPGGRRGPGRFRAALPVAAAAAILAATAPLVVVQARENRERLRSLPERVESSNHESVLLGRYLRRHTAPGERIYLWRNYYLDTYFYAGRLPASRVFVWFYWLRDFPPPGGFAALETDFRRHPPVYIVTGGSDILAGRDFPPMERILREEYREEQLPDALRNRLTPTRRDQVRLFRRIQPPLPFLRDVPSRTFLRGVPSRTFLRGVPPRTFLQALPA